MKWLQKPFYPTIYFPTYEKLKTEIENKILELIKIKI